MKDWQTLLLTLIYLKINMEETINKMVEVAENLEEATKKQSEIIEELINDLNKLADLYNIEK